MTATGRRRRRGQSGQAAVEVALALPVVAVLALVLLQAALVVRDQVLVTHAAREAAREAAVSGDRERVETAAKAATALDRHRLSVRIGRRDGPGGTVRVEVSYRSPTEVPMVGRAVGDVALRAAAVMRVEE